MIGVAANKHADTAASLGCAGSSLNRPVDVDRMGAPDEFAALVERIVDKRSIAKVDGERRRF